MSSSEFKTITACPRMGSIGTITGVATSGGTMFRTNVTPTEHEWNLYCQHRDQKRKDQLEAALNMAELWCRRPNEPFQAVDFDILVDTAIMWKLEDNHPSVYDFLCERRRYPQGMIIVILDFLVSLLKEKNLALPSKCFTIIYESGDSGVGILISCPLDKQKVYIAPYAFLPTIISLGYTKIRFDKLCNLFLSLIEKDPKVELLLAEITL